MHRRLASERGFTLIEVLASSLMVGFIVLGTFAGFDALGKSSADVRHHDQAAVLAAQSQEALRSDPITTLETLASAGSHVYKQTISGTTYTITQTAIFVPNENEEQPCVKTVEEHTQSGQELRIGSSVTWPQLAKTTTRPAVSDASIITPPEGSALEIDITNGGKPEAGVPGVTVISNGVTTTTSEAGCVIYAGIPATTTSFEAYKFGYVTKNGESKVIVKEVSIAPNITTHQEATLAEGGSITASFTHEAVANVKGDTFVATNTGLTNVPGFEVGSTELKYNAAGAYSPVTGNLVTGKYEASAKTPINATYYPTGDLFPFSNAAWTVYAGDCPNNNPSKFIPEVKGYDSASVLPGKNATAKLLTSDDVLNVYKGTKTSEGLATGTLYPIKITNLSCASSTIPNNAAAAPSNAAPTPYVHEQNAKEGHLEFPYQPFGKFELCLAYNNGATHRTYTLQDKEKEPAEYSYENKTVAGPTLPSIFLGDPTSYAANPYEVVVKTPSSGEAKC